MPNIALGQCLPPVVTLKIATYWVTSASAKHILQCFCSKFKSKFQSDSSWAALVCKTLSSWGGVGGANDIDCPRTILQSNL